MRIKVVVLAVILVLAGCTNSNTKDKEKNNSDDPYNEISKYLPNEVVVKSLDKLSTVQSFDLHVNTQLNYMNSSNSNELFERNLKVIQVNDTVMEYIYGEILFEDNDPILHYYMVAQGEELIKYVAQKKNGETIWDETVGKETDFVTMDFSTLFESIQSVTYLNKDTLDNIEYITYEWKPSNEDVMKIYGLLYNKKELDAFDLELKGATVQFKVEPKKLEISEMKITMNDLSSSKYNSVDSLVITYSWNDLNKLQPFEVPSEVVSNLK